MKNTKSKALEIVNMLKGYRGGRKSILETYENVLNATEDMIEVSYTDRRISILIGGFYYLYIFPDNTVRCNEDGWGLSKHLEADVFNKAMHL